MFPTSSQFHRSNDCRILANVLSGLKGLNVLNQTAKRS